MQINTGATSDALVEFVDLFPTFADIGGIPAPHYLEGQSLVPLLDAPGRNWKKAAFSQFERGSTRDGCAIVTERYRYVEWQLLSDGSVDSRELYDHEVDPDETVNVAGDLAMVSVVEELSVLLAAGPAAVRAEN